MMKDGTKH